MIRSVACMLCLMISAALSGCVTVQDPVATRHSAPVTGTVQIISATHAHALNALRAQHGLGALQPNATLERVASGHARDMMANGFFGHVSANGDTFVDRTRAQGYAFCHVAENLAKGQSSFDNVLQQWMTSSAHRRNLLHGQVTEFGLVRGPGNLWVLVLGTPGC